MLDRGLKVTINSDDPAYFPGYVHENLMAVQAAADLSRAEVVQLVRNAFEAAWLDDQARDEYLGAVDAYAAVH
jgi:adenosine deaminase